MNRRTYLQAISALFATATLGSCTTSSNKEEKAINRAEKADTLYNNSTNISKPPQIPEDNLNFYLVSDLGRNGYYKQKNVAETMGNIAEKIDIEFIIAAGDTHHFNGVASTQDPLWMTNYELVYSHPELMLDWFAINGNHEYRGNTQAVQDYSKISRRWIVPARYYSKLFEAGENESLEIFFIDTTPLISKYREKTEKYADAAKQSKEQQIQWLEKSLSASKAKWKLVVGHHPLYAFTQKSDTERQDMRDAIESILEKYNVDMYLCGHIHNFQHIKPAGSKVEYLVNSSGSLARKVESIDGTQYCSDKEGFTLFSVNDNELSFYLMDSEGNSIYQYAIKK